MSEWREILESLQKGEVRAASKVGKKWEAVPRVKKAILEAFKEGKIVEHSPCGGFVDKDNLPVRAVTPADGIRLVPGGSAVRTGAFVAGGVVIMPPAYVNVGAFVDEGCMIDSHVLVGSCAQIGKNVHLSAGVQIGGVLEPVGLAPVVVEDNCFVGAGAVIVEGIQVLSGAVIGTGVVLSQSVVVYDCIHERILDKGESIPENAVVVPGSRPVGDNRSWAKNMGLSINCALIIKYRNLKSEKSLELEQSLR